MDWMQLVYMAIPLLLGVGFIWLRVEKVMKALVELSEVITVVNSSLADKALTKEEVTAIKKEINDALGALKAIFQK